MKKIHSIIFLLFAVCLISSCSACRDYDRSQSMLDAEAKGKSTLLEAESSKKALIETAKAENESATLQAEAKIKIAKAEAQAEIERAHGVAKANEIIGNSLRGNNEYLRYLQIDAIKNSKGSKVYIPTEAGIPILEARK